MEWFPSPPPPFHPPHAPSIHQAALKGPEIPRNSVSTILTPRVRERRKVGFVRPSVCLSDRPTIWCAACVGGEDGNTEKLQPVSVSLSLSTSISGLKQWWKEAAPFSFSTFLENLFPLVFRTVSSLLFSFLNVWHEYVFGLASKRWGNLQRNPYALDPDICPEE